jgi:catechol 2,3-dioxygenase-like lactoylglutathione lyase family enzyme
VPQAISLDHVGFIIPDLAAAHERFSALGFTLTARADHTRKTPDGRTVSAGSAQHSVMFDTGYVELMQITDPGAGHQLTPAIDARYGLHVLALGASDAQAWHARCEREQVPVGPIMDWSRQVSTPERSGLARFRYFDSPWKPSDPSYICWVQHMTPELVRSPSLLRHANTARALDGIVYAGPGPAIASWAHRLLASGATQRMGAASGSLSLDEQSVRLQEDNNLPDVRPVALQIDVSDLSAFLRCAQASGCPTRVCPDGSVSVDPGADFGLRLDARQRR